MWPHYARRREGHLKQLYQSSLQRLTLQPVLALNFKTMTLHSLGPVYVRIHLLLGHIIIAWNTQYNFWSQKNYRTNILLSVVKNRFALITFEWRDVISQAFPGLVGVECWTRGCDVIATAPPVATIDCDTAIYGVWTELQHLNSVFVIMRSGN